MYNCSRNLQKLLTGSSTRSTLWAPPQNCTGSPWDVDFGLVGPTQESVKDRWKTCVQSLQWKCKWALLTEQGQERKYQLVGCKNVHATCKNCRQEAAQEANFGLVHITTEKALTLVVLSDLVLPFLSLFNVTIIISISFPLKKTVNHKFMALIWNRIRHLETWESYHCKNKDLLFWPLQLCWCWH